MPYVGMFGCRLLRWHGARCVIRNIGYRQNTQHSQPPVPHRSYSSYRSHRSYPSPMILNTHPSSTTGVSDLPARAALEQDPTDPAAATRLRDSLSTTSTRRTPIESPDRSINPQLSTINSPDHSPLTTHSLLEALAVLDGGEAWLDRVESRKNAELGLPVIPGSLVIHPREKAEQQHRVASFLARGLHLLEGDDIARAVRGVTGRTSETEHPGLHETAARCAKELDVECPDIHVARGDIPYFSAFLDRSHFLCIHEQFLDEPAAPLRFALGGQLQHIRGKHVAVLQLRAQRLEGFIIDEIPFLIRTPMVAATRVVGWTRANLAARKMGQMLPKGSGGRRAMSALGDFLPDKDQETVLPEVVHDWVRRWIQGVEFSGDRAGLFLCGSIAVASAMLLRLSTESRDTTELMKRGARDLLKDPEALDRDTADRLEELLRFSLSTDFLSALEDDPTL